MSARRWLLLFVVIGFGLLTTAFVIAFRLQQVVMITNGLITGYSTLEQWQQIQRTQTESLDQLPALGQKILDALPGTIGQGKTPTADFKTLLLSGKTVEETSPQLASLRAALTEELFECHRLQNLYSSHVITVEILLTMLILGIGVAGYYTGRRAEDYRLAPFPESNPNPVFGLSGRGDVIYTNQAAILAVERFVGVDAQVQELLPEDYLTRIQNLSHSRQLQDTWIQSVHGHILEFQVQRIPDQDRVHIYSEDITEQEEIRSRNEFIAYHDPVCLLANRQKLEQIIDSANESDNQFTLVMTFVSGFAKVLSTLGTSVTDQFARDFSFRIKNAYRQIPVEADREPLIFRFDSNLFGCLYWSELTSEQHQRLEYLLSETVKAPFVYKDHETYFTVQSGATSEPTTVSSRHIIQQANIALHSLSETKKTYQKYDESIEQDIQEKDALERDLRRAIELDELMMVYQPQLDLQANRLIGFEALMRWQRQGQFIPPFQFIPIAENNGQIHNLGHWAFRDVLRQALDWQALAEVDAGIVAVNVSSPEFARASFVDDVTQALKDIPIDPALIQIEITESLLLEDEAQAISRMQLLKSLGFTLAIDDFGTGYSSFSYLSRFPIDKLKIDRSFIVNMKNGRRDIAIVAAMINVAHQLGLKVIAEGVETEQERDILVDLNCDQIQGYLYGKPMSAAKATLFASTKH